MQCLLPIDNRKGGNSSSRPSRTSGRCKSESASQPVTSRYVCISGAIRLELVSLSGGELLVGKKMKSDPPGLRQSLFPFSPTERGTGTPKHERAIRAPTLRGGVDAFDASGMEIRSDGRKPSRLLLAPSLFPLPLSSTLAFAPSLEVFKATTVFSVASQLGPLGERVFGPGS